MTKPAWLFIWLYPFENWWGLKSLLWIPGVLIGTLLVVPLLDRFQVNSPRRRWVVLGIAVVALAVMVGLGTYAAVTAPAEHLVD